MVWVDSGYNLRDTYVVAERLLAADNPDYEGVPVESGGPVAIRGGEGLVINYGRCCGPVPGDPIVGHMTPGKGFVVHLETCANLVEARRRRRGRREIIPAHWANTHDEEFLTTLRIEVRRKKGVIAELAAGVTDADAGVENIHVEERNAELSSVIVTVSVKDRQSLARAIRRLRAIASVTSINRVSA